MVLVNPSQWSQTNRISHPYLWNFVTKVLFILFNKHQEIYQIIKWVFLAVWERKITYFLWEIVKMALMEHFKYIPHPKDKTDNCSTRKSASIREMNRRMNKKRMFKWDCRIIWMTIAIPKRVLSGRSMRIKDIRLERWVKKALN